MHRKPMEKFRNSRQKHQGEKKRRSKSDKKKKGSWFSSSTKPGKGGPQVPVAEREARIPLHSGPRGMKVAPFGG